MSKTIYDEFLDLSGRADRDGQREAVRLLVELSDGKDVEAYALSAPTGTGKSFAALLAGVHNARKGRRTIIGTSTVVLSDQYEKDIRVIQEAFPLVKYQVLKGASNYYCGNKAAQEIHNTKSAVEVRNMKNKLFLLRRGDLEVIPLWARSDTDFCLTCAEKLHKSGTSACEYANARAAALTAQVVVTTHAMINVDARMKGNEGRGPGPILGSVWLTVFDEAHKASASLLYNEALTQSAWFKMDYMGVTKGMDKYRRDAFIDHFGDVNESDWYRPSKELASKTLSIWPTTVELNRFYDAAKNILEREKPATFGTIRFLRKAREVLEQIEDGETDGGVALWCSRNKHNDGSYTRRYKLQEMTPDDNIVDALTSMRTAWMSATIGTASKPTYSLDKCGMSPKLFELPSPFDYSKQLEWTVRTEKQVPDQAGLVASINKHWPGGTAVLTPFHKRKDKIAESVAMLLRGELVQSQSTESSRANAAVVQAHCSSADAGGSPVLVGVEIFSTGIDLPGARLTKLIIADLFPLRDDWAYVMWRCRWIESVGGTGLDGFVLPERAITLEQQIGRVVRRETDTGVVVFYVADKDWRSGSEGERIIAEALARFPGARRI